jgi:metal-responsive CopG/Arc/MetJ family transcriptional regulator
MSVAKVAISIEPRLLKRLDSLVEQRVFQSRSQAIQNAIAEKSQREVGRPLVENLEQEETEETENFFPPLPLFAPVQFFLLVG